ncbi:MAG: MopE-related protein [Ferruginibacter sp.]
MKHICAILVFTNNGTILANGKSLNIFPVTNPVIGGTITIAAGSQVKFGIPSTTTTIASNAVINGAGTLYFFDGNHQVNTTSYDVGSTYIGQTYSAANVYFNASNVALNYLFIYSGVLGGPATKLLKDDLVFISGQLTGGSIENTDTSVCYFGAGNPGLGAINTSFTNNGLVEVSPYYGGCCTEPVINMSGGSFTNNGTFNVTGSGGIRYVGLSNGTFINNAGGVINSNVGDVSFGEPSFRMQPANFTNLGTINVLRNIMELGAFAVGGVINVSPGTLLRSTGTVTFNGSLINNNGNITVPFDFINAAAKTLKGNGTFSSDVALNNSATVVPGSSPGILTVAGNYTQGAAALDIEIGGTTPGTGHDRLVVTGAASISGTLNATEVNGFSPQSFTSIDILTASSVTGTFSQVNLPPLWSVQYAPNKVSLVKYLEFVYYRDQDGDGFGNVADTIRRFATTAPTGYTADSTDCNDANAAVNPAATEVCDGIDNNCDGIIDTVVTSGIVCGMATSEGQSFTLTAPPGKVFTSVDFASYGTPNGTCGNFTLGSCHASSTLEIVQGLVIGQNSVTLTQNYQIFGDPCVGIVKRFYVQARYSEVIPLAQTYYADTDGDGFGNPAVSQLACSQPSGYVLNNTDCNDNSAAVYPGATEVCDGLDNDCDGQIDLVINNTGLVAYYPFSGNANDARGSLNGTVNGATLTTDRFGNANSAYSFDGVDDFIGLNGSFNGYIELTISAWYKMTAASPDLQAIVSSDQSGKFVHTQISSAGISNCAVYYDNNNALLLNIPPPALNQWVHMALVVKSGNSKLYINGVEYSSSNADFSFISGSNLLRIGSGYLNGRFFNGSIDDIKIYNVALTPTQILQDFNTVPLSQAYYADADGDGFGNPAVSQSACSQPAGFVLNNTDCNDNSAAVYPGATEVCDGLDNDCDGNIDAIVTLGVVCGTADENASVTLTAPAGRVFTAVNFASYGTPDGTCNNFSIGSCHASNSLSIVQGMVIGQNSVSIPASNGLFGDPCPGTFKRLYIQATYGEVVPLTQIYYADTDGDGFGNSSVTTTFSCGSQAPVGYVSDNTDCNDANANIYPGVQPGTVSGTATLCIGTTASYSSTGNAGGSWSSVNEDIATVDPVTGLVTAISAGTTSIIYTINTCSGPQSASQTININATPVVDPVSNQMVNHGSSTTVINFSGTATSYTWVNDNPSIGLAASGTGISGLLPLSTRA